MANLSPSQRLHHDLEQIITTAEPGKQLPSEPRLAAQLGVSRATLREAMRDFETQGLLIRRQGVGTFVVHPTHVFESGLEVLESIDTLAKRIGLSVAIGNLEVYSCPASEDQTRRLKLDPGAYITCVTRVILSQDRPVAYLLDAVPSKYLSPDEITDGFSGSVLDVILERGEPTVASSRCEISAVAADTDVARALRIQRGDAVLRFESLMYSRDNDPIDYSFSFFLPGYFRFHVARKIA